MLRHPAVVASLLFSKSLCRVAESVLASLIPSAATRSGALFHTEDDQVAQVENDHPIVSTPPPSCENPAGFVATLLVCAGYCIFHGYVEHDR